MVTKETDRRAYPFEPIRIPEFWDGPTSTLAELVWKKVESAKVNITSRFTPNISVSERSAEIQFPEDVYGEQVVEHLQQGGSLILLSNHESHIDHALLLMYVAIPLKDRVDGVSYIWATGSKLFSDYFQRVLTKDEQQQYRRDIAMKLPKRIRYMCEGFFIRMLAKQYGMNAFPVLQPDQKGQSKEFLEKVISVLGRQSLQDFGEHVLQPQRIGYFALEGGRDEGKVKPAVSGLAKLVVTDRKEGSGVRKQSSENSGRKKNQILFLPIGVKGTKEVLPKYIVPWDFKHEVQLVVGKPVSSTEVSEEAKKYSLSISDILMLHVIQELPPEKWGHYTKKEFKQYRIDHGLPF